MHRACVVVCRIDCTNVINVATSSSKDFSLQGIEEIKILLSIRCESVIHEHTVDLIYVDRWLLHNLYRPGWRIIGIGINRDLTIIGISYLLIIARRSYQQSSIAVVNCKTKSIIGISRGIVYLLSKYQRTRIVD